jgi:hypothetical protein
MLTQGTQLAIADAARAISTRLLEEFQRRVGEIRRGTAAAGQAFGTRQAAFVDDAAGKALQGAAAELSEIVFSGHAADNCVDIAARVEDVAQTFSRHLGALKNVVVMARDDLTSPVWFQAAKAPTRHLEFAAVELEREQLAKLGLRVRGSQGRSSMTNHISIANGAHVANLQIGNRNVAHVQQTTELPVALQQLTAAVEALSAIVSASTLEQTTAEEVRRALDEVQLEVRAQRPNRLKVSSLLAGVGGAVQSLAAAPAAYEAIMASWAIAAPLLKMGG